MATATYVYCVVQGARRPSAAGVPAGLPGGETPRLDEVDSRMWVVHAPVPLARYGTGALQESLRDLEWVSKIAVAHEAVVEHFAGLRGVTVIPMKLFTLFSSPARAMGEGGSIPFMAMLGARFPGAQFLVVGVLGPGSNAHGPNEFLDLPTAKRLTACLVDVLGAHARR